MIEFLTFLKGVGIVIAVLVVIYFILKWDEKKANSYYNKRNKK